MKTNIKYVLLLLLFAGLLSCSEDGPDNGNSIFDDNATIATEFDKWLDHYFVAPYNITWEYRLVDGESDLTYYLVPADYWKSVKFAKVFRHVILEGYDEIWGDSYNTKAYFPKYLNLVGNYAYNNNGTIVLGTAEAGIKITFYGVNNFNFDALISSGSDAEVVQRFKTTHHEFTHSMHQQIPFSDDFRNVSISDYIEDDWNSGTLQIALDAGFISMYARKNSNEDFAETYSWYVSYSEAWWNARVSAASAEGMAKINEKLSILRTYMKNNWSLDLDVVREINLRRIGELPNLDLIDLTVK